MPLISGCVYDLMSYATVGCPKANDPLAHTHLFKSDIMTDPHLFLALLSSVSTLDCKNIILLKPGVDIIL